MATLTYTLNHRCANGGHVSFGLNFNGTDLGTFGFDTDEVRAALNQMTQQERNAAAQLILRIHCAGKTRAQLVTEFGSVASPIPVTITI